MLIFSQPHSDDAGLHDMPHASNTPPTRLPRSPPPMRARLTERLVISLLCPPTALCTVPKEAKDIGADKDNRSAWYFSTIYVSQLFQIGDRCPGAQTRDPKRITCIRFPTPRPGGRALDLQPPSLEVITAWLRPGSSQALFFNCPCPFP